MPAVAERAEAPEDHSVLLALFFPSALHIEPKSRVKQDVLHWCVQPDKQYLRKGFRYFTRNLGYSPYYIMIIFFFAIFKIFKCKNRF